MKKISVLIIGKKSLLAKNYFKHSKIKKITIVDRSSLKNLNLENFSHILNFSFDPNLKKRPINFKRQLDYKISKKIRYKNIIYILPSTRLVYSNRKKKIFKERQKLSKINNIYGNNKRKIEMKLNKTLEKNLLVLRISTVLLFDTSSRNLFISRILRSLKKSKRIVFDIDINKTKDFIPVNKFSEALDKLILRKKTGIFNLSSGIPIKIISLLKSILNGFGSGNISYTAIKKNNSYCLDNKKLSKNIKFSISKKYILNYCKNLGKKLNA
tara:strand:+ start:1885 stop:2691 length:807 start_codon:yes stop_codon:yes gene_type:complete